MLVTEAVDSLAARGESATVNAVARELGIDQSGASRMIRGAVDAGCLAMVTGTSDARRREASITAAGVVALEWAHAWQEEVFAELTAGWSGARRDELRRAMADLIERSRAIGSPMPDERSG